MTHSKTTSSQDLTASAVAQVFHVSAKTIVRWADQGLLPCTRTLGGPTGRGHRRFSAAEVRKAAVKAGLVIHGTGL